MKKAFKVKKTGNILVEVNQNYYWVLVKENNKLKKTTLKEYDHIDELYGNGSDDFQMIHLDDAECISLEERVAKFEASLPQNVAHAQTPFAALLQMIA